jgi:serine/threonine protein kinase
MEYYCGGDLSRYRRGWGMLGTQERKEKVGWVRCVIRDVLLGLKRVHEMGYVFRDLKL